MKDLDLIQIFILWDSIWDMRFDSQILSSALPAETDWMLQLWSICYCSLKCCGKKSSDIATFDSLALCSVANCYINSVMSAAALLDSWLQITPWPSPVRGCHFVISVSTRSYTFELSVTTVGLTQLCNANAINRQSYVKSCLEYDWPGLGFIGGASIQTTCLSRQMLTACLSEWLWHGVVPLFR